MSNTVQQVVSSFDALPDADKLSAVGEILRRLPDYGDVPAAALDALADELFAALDAEEEARAGG